MYAFVIPQQGRNLLAKLLVGEKLILTRVGFGSGKLTGDPLNVTDLIAYEVAGSSTIPLIKDHVCTFTVEYRNDMDGGLAEGFWINEYAVYALDPDVGEVVLYYGSLGDYPQHVAPYSGGDVDIRQFPVAIAITDGVSVKIDYPPLAVLTQDDALRFAGAVEVSAEPTPDVGVKTHYLVVGYAHWYTPMVPDTESPPEPEAIVETMSISEEGEPPVTGAVEDQDDLAVYDGYLHIH